MVKVKNSGKENKKKMSEIVEHRRSSGVSQHNLRRSKSVRESLRIIGTKFLHHRHDVQKSPSLSNITDEDNNYQKFVFENEGIQTILKTPMDKPVLQKKNHNYFKNLDFLHKNKPENFPIGDIPETIAPKAAALLEIPIKENVQVKNSAYALYKAKRCSKLSESDVDKIEEEDIIEELRIHDGNFSRNSFRLSMSTKRKHTWSSFSSTSSMYLKCLLK